MIKAGTKFPRAVVVLAVFALALVTPLMAQAPSAQAWNVLQAGLGDKTLEERAAAVRVLGLVENDPKAQEFATKALSDSKPEVRAVAADALGQMNAKSAAPLLEQNITSDEKDVGVILSCARSLVQLGDNRGYAVYNAVLTGEKNSGGGLMNEQKKDPPRPCLVIVPVAKSWRAY